MKKIIAIVMILSFSLAAQAQNDYDPFHDRGMIDSTLRSVAILTLFALIAYVIITVIRAILGYRLKNRMIEKGVSENLAGQFLESGTKSSKVAAMKWAIILCGIGTGITLIWLSRPYGIHSLALMIFSIAASFLVFYFFLNKSGEE